MREARGKLRHLRHAGGHRHEAQQGQKAEHEGVGRQQGRIPLDHPRTGGAENGRGGMRIQEQRHGRTERQRRVAGVSPGAASGRLGQKQFLRRDMGEDRAKTAQLDGNDDHSDNHCEIDQQVLDDRDHRRGAQTGGIGEGRKHREGDDQRNMAGNPEGADHCLHADQLQRDIGHCGEDTGHADGQRQPAIAIAAADEFRTGNIAVIACHLPKFRKHQKQDRVADHSIGNGEKAQRAGAEHQCRNGDEGVGGIGVTADEEPGDPGAEAPAAQAPFLDMAHIAGFPAPGDEAENDDEDDQRQKDDRSDGVTHSSVSSRSSARKTT